MKAIETKYKGYRFRSRLEARWAVFFDALGVEWEYEKEGFELGEAGRYLPDFWLPQFSLWVEVKGADCTEAERAKIDSLAKLSGKEIVIAKGVPDSGYSCEWGGAILNPTKSIVPYPLDNLTRSLSGDFDSFCLFGVKVKCPLCGFDYTHWVGIEEVKGDDITGSAWAGRGAALRIKMRCEEMHSWNIRFGFHKGQVFMNIENVEEFTYDFALFLAGSDQTLRDNAIEAARSARFEHGESPDAIHNNRR